MILADKIIDLRKKNGWSQEELAEKLGVSRQAVSKWESAQAIPDLGRVLAMADLFSVTTDYLLRDENEAPTPATMEDSAPDSNVRRVSMEEANAFLALCRKQAPTRALAVSLCVLSPIPLLMILSRTGEGPAAGVGSIIGVVILLLLVVAAVVIFLRQGMESKEYEYLEQEDIETAYGVSGMVKEKQAAYRETCTRGIIVGVVLCILSVIPVLLGTLAADSAAAPERIMLPCVSLLLAMVAVAVYLFVRVGMVQGSFQRLLEEGDYTREGKRAARSPIVPIYWCLVTAAYLAWSFITMAWDRTWSDGLKAIPNILLAITLMAVLGANMKNVIISLTIVSIPGVARIARSQALLAREQTYAEAMTAVGASRTRILWRHILPNILSPIIVQMTFTFATAIISEASLSFLGAGIPSPYPSWGGMLNEARGYVYMGWWMIVFPAIFTALSVLGFNLFGDGLRDLIDPLSGR